MPQCVFSMDYVYDVFGDVANYIDSRGDYMTTVASALTLVVILELMTFLMCIRGFIFCAGIHVHLYIKAGVSLNVTHSDFQQQATCFCNN